MLKWIMSWLLPRHLAGSAFLMAALLTSSLALAAAHDTQEHNPDPLEKINRATFAFNEKLDTWLLRPLAVCYNAATPKPVQGLIGNFFQNLGEVRNLTHALLQLKLRDAGVSGTRFVVNSTVGMFGLLDVGSALGLEHRYQDFGLTLGRWKAPPGPYLMLPVLGPHTVRSAIGIFPDMQLDLTSKAPRADEWALRGTSIVNRRASLLQKDKLIFGDRYTFVRDAYLQRRHYLITGETAEDDF